MREHGSASRALTELAIAELPRGNILLELGQVEAIKQATIAGWGISCLPKAATIDAVQAGRLVLLDTPFLDLKDTFHWSSINRDIRVKFCKPSYASKDGS